MLFHASILILAFNSKHYYTFVQLHIAASMAVDLYKIIFFYVIKS